MATYGDRSSLRATRGVLREYSNAERPLELVFEFNPSTLSRTRSVTIDTGGAPGTRGGYDFADRSETARASQGVTVGAETFTLKILLDATDRMNAGDRRAATEGIQGELDTLRCMLEPKVQSPDGARTLAAIGHGGERAFARHAFASVLLFSWGVQTLPVFMTEARVELMAFLPGLAPYRAELTLTLQVIESRNPFYGEELKRQLASAGQDVGALPGGP